VSVPFRWVLKPAFLFSFSIRSVMVDGTGHVVSAGNSAVSCCRRVLFVCRPGHLLCWGFPHVFLFPYWRVSRCYFKLGAATSFRIPFALL
jgi:hypothetical protein